MGRHPKRMICERNQGKRWRSGARDAILDGRRRPDAFRASATRSERQRSSRTAIPMMQAADLRNRDNSAAGRRFDVALDRRVSVEG